MHQRLATVRRSSHRPLLSTLAVLAAFVTSGTARAQAPVDLLESFDPAKHVVSGNWTRNTEGIVVTSEPRSRAVLVEQIGGSYSLTLEFTRISGKDSLGVVLPVGSGQCVLHLSLFDGEAHGIGIVAGRLARDNPTTIRPGTLQNDHPYRLQIEVEVNGDQASIRSQLDGRPFLNWRGNPASLSMLDFWKLPVSNSLGLFTNSEYLVHGAVIAKLNRSMRMTQAPRDRPAPESVPEKTGSPSSPNGDSLEFQGNRWAVGRSEQASVEEFKGKRCLHVQGKEESFVYLPEVSFTDGTIEVDIASSTFSGIGFHGSKDGKVAHKVYFRPFNSGTEKHENTVQYSMMGQPEFGWRALRKKSPGKYESGADIRENEWFHVRLEIEGGRVEAYVSDAPKPVLVVERLLDDSRTGKIGVWGWDSYFTNFRFTPEVE